MRKNAGFSHLIPLLAIELCLLYPAQVAGHLARVRGSAAVGLLGLWTEFMHFAATPMVIVFALGVLLHLGLRLSKWPLTLWSAAAIAAYAYLPHVVLTAIGVLLNVLIYDGSPPTALIQTWRVVPLLPVVALVIVAWRWGRAGEFEADNSPTLTTDDLRADPETSPVGKLRQLWPAVVAWGLVTSALVTVAFDVADRWQAVRPLMVGDSAPEFTLRRLDGRIANESMLTGKVTLIDFWATWCGPCVAAMPDLIALDREFSGSDFQMLSVNEDQNASLATAFRAEHGLPFEVFLDNGRMAHMYDVRSFPTVMLVDRHGTVRHLHVGATPASTLRREVRALLQADHHH